MEPPLRVSRDLFVFTERVRGLLGKTPVISHSLRFLSSASLELRTNGVWSHQVEAEYSQKFAEKLPPNWVSKLEEINQIKVDIPVPNSVR